MEHDYRYAASSTVTAGGVLLATSGGCTSTGPAAAPRFFSGFLEHPDQAADCLLAVARVARTRFYVPPGMVAAILRAADPVVTSNGDRLRFESFSACCGVHIRFDALEGSLDGPALETGTTNVDFNPPMREALARIGGRDPVGLDVGLDDVTITTLDTSVVEKKVPLPERWLKGFAEVQVATARMEPRLEASAIEARRFIGALPRQPSRAGAAWVTRATGGLRLSTQPAAGAVPLPGPERLRPFEPLLRFARRLRVYSTAPRSEGRSGLEGSTGSAWEIELADARIVVTLSPDVRRGFSGEGGVLEDLADEQAVEDADLVSVLLSWEPRRRRRRPRRPGRDGAGAGRPGPDPPERGGTGGLRPRRGRVLPSGAAVRPVAPRSHAPPPAGGSGVGGAGCGALAARRHRPGRQRRPHVPGPSGRRRPAVHLPVVGPPPGRPGAVQARPRRRPGSPHGNCLSPWAA